MLKKSLLLLAVVGSSLPAVSFAEDAAPAAAPADPLSFNIGLVSDYRYRGISQSRLKPALQGGIDYASSSGFYVGAWASTIKWIKDSGGDANVEIDVYGGYKGEIAKDLSFDVGVLEYVYPGAKATVWNMTYDNPNTTELYGALTYGPATLKYSHSVTNLFGNTDSKGSGYVDLSASFDVGGIGLAPHLGYQKVKNYTSTLSYVDYSFTVSKDFSGFLLSAAIVGTDTKDVPANASFGSFAYYSPDGKNLGKATVVLGVKKTF